VEPKRAAEILRQRHMETPSVTVSEACLIGALAIEWCEARCALKDAFISPIRPIPTPDQIPVRDVALTSERVARRAYLAAAHPEKKHDR